MTDETTRYGATTEPNQVEERLRELETGLSEELGDVAAVYPVDGDDPYVAVETDDLAAEVRPAEGGVAVSYELPDEPSDDAVEAAEAIQDAVLPEAYEAGQTADEYGPVEVESPGWTW